MKTLSKPSARLMVGADFHGSIDSMESLIQAAREHRVGFILSAGDLEPRVGTGSARRRPYERLADSGFPCAFVMGNTDRMGWPGGGSLSDCGMRRVELCGIGIVGFPYCVPFLGGPYEKPESEIEALLAPLAPLVDESTIFLSHSPPYGILDLARNGARGGSMAVARFVAERKPLIHIFGHIHEAAGFEGRSLNAARGIWLVEIDGKAAAARRIG
jgi:Icc-related predicted phosphoesterase